MGLSVVATSLVSRSSSIWAGTWLPCKLINTQFWASPHLSATPRIVGLRPVWKRYIHCSIVAQRLKIACEYNRCWAKRGEHCGIASDKVYDLSCSCVCTCLRKRTGQLEPVASLSVVSLAKLSPCESLASETSLSVLRVECGQGPR